MRPYWICGLALTGAFLAAMPSGAAEDLPAALAACRKEPDDAKRLACYDRYAAEMTPAATAANTADTEVATAAAATAAAAAAMPKTSVDPPAASAAPVAAAPQATTAQASAGAAPAAVPPTAEEKFGYTEAMTREEKKEPELQEILATVTQLGTRGYGELVVTLDNGQVWAQKAAQSNFHLKIGDEVRIKAGALGAFLMSKVSSDRTTRVTRVR